MLIYNDSYCAACYFRTTADPPMKKCLLQLTERCNLHCQHCFVSSVNSGNDMEFSLIETHVLPTLIENNVSKVTLTGGEPFVYTNIIDVTPGTEVAKQVLGRVLREHTDVFLHFNAHVQQGVGHLLDNRRELVPRK